MPPDDYFDGPGPANDTPGPAIPFLHAPDLANDLPPLSFLVDDLRLVRDPGGQPHMFAGYGYSSKSVAMQAMSLALASDRPVWGPYRGLRGARVCHVDLEQGRRLTQERYQRLARSMGVDLREVGSRLRLVDTPELSLLRDQEDAWCRLADGYDLVWVDSLRVAARGTDENSSAFAEHLYLLGRIGKRVGSQTLVIHHANKPQQNKTAAKYSIRGSGAIFAALDCAYVLSGDKGEPVTMSQEKARSYGQLVEDVSLSVSDEVEPTNGTHQPDPRWGLRVAVHGPELAVERKAAAQAKAETEQAKRKAAELMHLLERRPQGLSVSDAKASISCHSGSRWVAIRMAAEAFGLHIQSDIGGRGRGSTLFHPKHKPIAGSEVG
jgi:AAA domain-containing protein